MYCSAWTVRGHRRGFSPGAFAYADFGPWGRKRRFFESGEVRLALLSLLAERDQHGYDLMKALEERSGGVYKASAGTIYPTLQMLEDEGLIVSRQEDGRKIYSITAAGQAELERERERVDRIWRRAERWQEWSDWGSGDFAEIAGPFGGLVKATLRAVGGSDSPEQRRRIRDIIERARDEMESVGRK